MKPAHALWVCLAVLVLVLSAVPLSAQGSVGGNTPAESGTAALPALDGPRAYLAKVISHDPALTADQRAALEALIPSLPMSTVMALIQGNEQGYLSTMTVGAAEKLAAIFTPFDCFINCEVDAGLSTCAVGAGFAVGINAFAGEEGGLGIPVAAGVGCVGGLLAGSLGFYFGGQQAIVDDINTQALNWLRAQATVMGNCVNTTGSFLGNAIQLLNFTQDYLNARAESAVYSQLANTSFNVLLDAQQSGIAAQAMDVPWAAAQTQANCMRGFQSWFSANFANGGRFASASSPSLNLRTIQGTTDSYLPTTAPGWVGGVVENPTVNPAYMWLSHGAATEVVACTTTCNGNTFQVVATPVAGGPPIRIWGCTSGNTTCWPNPALFSGASGIYNVTFTGSFAANFLIYGGEDITTASSTSAFTQWFLSTNVVTSGQYHQGTSVQGTVNGQQTATIPFFPNASWNPSYENALLVKAEQAAQVYWAFLRSLGFLSAADVPANCVIPTPNEILPAGVDQNTLTVTEEESLFYGWLQGLATFYNTTLNATNFCGTQGHRQFVLGSNGYWPLFINATASVYLANSTQYPSEVFGNVSTWAYTHQQALITPLLWTETIPVGAPFKIPANDPTVVYLIKSGVWLTLHGNGTNVSEAQPICFNGCGLSTSFIPLTGSPAPGAAIFLDSCVVGGNPQPSCTITVQTINQTIIEQNTTCEPSCGGTGVGFSWALPNPFTALAELFCSALSFVLGPNCVSELTTIFQVVFVIVVVLIAIWAISWVYNRFEGRRRGPETKG